MDDGEPLEIDSAVKCKECTIFIGPGYQETRPFPAPDGRGHLCWRCYESYWRQAERKATRARTGF